MILGWVQDTQRASLVNHWGFDPALNLFVYLSKRQIKYKSRSGNGPGGLWNLRSRQDAFPLHLPNEKHAAFIMLACSAFFFFICDLRSKLIQLPSSYTGALEPSLNKLKERRIWVDVCLPRHRLGFRHKGGKILGSPGASLLLHRFPISISCRTWCGPVSQESRNHLGLLALRWQRWGRDDWQLEGSNPLKY